jgi:hypothetical protein
VHAFNTVRSATRDGLRTIPVPAENQKLLPTAIDAKFTRRVSYSHRRAEQAVGGGQWAVVRCPLSVVRCPSQGEVKYENGPAGRRGRDLPVADSQCNQVQPW